MVEVYVVEFGLFGVPGEFGAAREPGARSAKKELCLRLRFFEAVQKQLGFKVTKVMVGKPEVWRSCTAIGQWNRRVHLPTNRFNVPTPDTAMVSPTSAHCLSSQLRKNHRRV